MLRWFLLSGRYDCVNTGMQMVLDILISFPWEGPPAVGLLDHTAALF